MVTVVCSLINILVFIYYVNRWTTFQGDTYCLSFKLSLQCFQAARDAKSENVLNNKDVPFTMSATLFYHIKKENHVGGSYSKWYFKGLIILYSIPDWQTMTCAMLHKLIQWHYID